MKNKLQMVVVSCALIFTGCLSSPFLHEDASKRLAAVDSLVDQRQMVEVALDYCTEPYQELPTGCPMDVRIRAVERLTDQDLLMAVASFSIVRAQVRDGSCLVALDKPNPELKKIAIDKLTERKYIASVLGAKDPFAIRPLFAKVLIGQYKIEGTVPATAKDDWYSTAKGREKVIAKAFCDSLTSGVPVEVCQKVYELLPSTPSVYALNDIKDAYGRMVKSADSVNAAIRALNIAAIIPASTITREDIDAMCNRVCARIVSINELVAFVKLLNGNAKQYLTDADATIKGVAVHVFPKLRGMKQLSAFAGVLKKSKSPWIGKIGFEDSVRKCAGEVNNIGGIKAFAAQLSSFNSLMIPNKTDVSGDAVIAVLNAVVADRAFTDGRKDTLKDFVKAVAELPADILSDKAIVAIFASKVIDREYSRAIRADGFREERGNELFSAAMQSGSLGNLVAAGTMVDAMGGKESPLYTRMFAHLISVMRTDKAFIDAAKFAHIYYPRNMLLDAAKKRMTDSTVASCFLEMFAHSSESNWFMNEALRVGMNFARYGYEAELAIMQPIFKAYAKNQDKGVQVRAIACFNEPEMIERSLFTLNFADLQSSLLNRNSNGYAKEAFFFACARARKLYDTEGDSEKASRFTDRLATYIADGIGETCRYFWEPEFAVGRGVSSMLDTIANSSPSLWVKIMLRVKFPPCCAEFSKVVDRLSSTPNLLADFLADYQCAPYVSSNGTFYYGDDCQNVLGKSILFYYDSEWYWKALCAASAMELSSESRAKLNIKMKHFAVNGIDLKARQTVFAAIRGDSDKKEIREAWAKADADIPNKATALFNFSLDDNIPELKKELEWKKNYRWKRIRLRGHLLDVKGTTVILDGGNDITDMKFASKMAKSQLGDHIINMKKESAERSLASAKATVEWCQRSYDSAVSELKILEDAIAGKKVKYKYWISDGKGQREMNKDELIVRKKRDEANLVNEKRDLDRAFEELAEAKAELSLINGTAEDIKLVLKYYVSLPQDECEAIAEMGKGALVVFEACPTSCVQPVTRLEDREANKRVFSVGMKDGRWVKD